MTDIIQHPLFADLPEKHLKPLHELPLPLIVAEQWGFVLIPVDRTGNTKDYLYPVQEWIVGLIGCSKQHAASTWSQANYAAELNSSKLPYLASNGKTYRMDYVDARGLYRIAQELRPLKSRPELVTVLNDIKNYLAKAGAFVDEQRLQEAQQKYAQIRSKGKFTRNQLTEWLGVVFGSSFPFGQFTNIEYRGLFGRDAKTLKAQTGVNNARDAMTSQALSFVDIAETSCLHMLNGRETVDITEALDIMRRIATALGVNVRILENIIGIDLATGLPLLHA